MSPASTGSARLDDPFHAMLEDAGHRLIRSANGEVDIFVLDYDFHNGPGCELCGNVWCQHCQNEITQCDKRLSV